LVEKSGVEEIALFVMFWLKLEIKTGLGCVGIGGRGVCSVVFSRLVRDDHGSMMQREVTVVSKHDQGLGRGSV
jgi:hypothetical protein